VWKRHVYAACTVLAVCVLMLEIACVLTRIINTRCLVIANYLPRVLQIAVVAGLIWVDLWICVFPLSLGMASPWFLLWIPVWFAILEGWSDFLKKGGSSSVARLFVDFVVGIFGCFLMMERRVVVGFAR